MSTAFKDVIVLRDGDAQGNRMVVKLTTKAGAVIHAIAVPQDTPVRTGPTWAYLFESEGLNLVDAGSPGSLRSLTDGIECAGFSASDVDRVIITHGHSDHDGAAKRFVDETGAELWAHDVYAHMLPFDSWDIERGMESPFGDRIRGKASANGRGDASESSWHVDATYAAEKKGMEVSNRVRDEDRVCEMRFMHTPGHSPDELCVSMDGVVFTGDHVLPEITPHPTAKVRYTDEVERALPPEYRDANSLYGLATYLGSLQRIAALGPDVQTLPAHRLFNKNRFNFATVRRAGEIIGHHARRLERILGKMNGEPASLEEVTRGLFPRTTLTRSVLHLALTEAVAHVELLQDAGDLEMTPDHRLRPTGSANYRQFIRELTHKEAAVSSRTTPTGAPATDKLIY